jgi:signal transduction histidine kinase
VAQPDSYRDTSFERLVSLAAHDLRTPLATVFGFSRTLGRDESLSPQQRKYVEMIESATAQLDELVAELSLVARIAAGRYQPRLVEGDSLAVARYAEEHLGADRVLLSGPGGRCVVDREPVERAVSALIQATLRHGTQITAERITKIAAPVVLGQEIRDLGAAAAVRLIEFLGGAVTVDGERLVIRLPA